ncbi:MAG: chromate transporter [Ruminococcaceae bacterium]|nr:chromate transporter [Oscillospiraceae bacterium]
MCFQERLKKAAQLFGIFFKIGAFTFGGGYAMIPLIEHETVEKRHLIDKEEISDIVAIAESTPGPIAINSATFIGYRSCGVIGSVAATLGVVLPSLFLITLIALFMRRIMDNRFVKYAFFGIRAGVLALIAKAVVNFWKRADHGVFGWCVMIAAFLWSAILDWSVIALIALCAIAGCIFCAVQRKRGKMQ